MKDHESMLDIPRKYLNEKLLLTALVGKYKIKFRTWRIILSDGEQIGVATSASRPIKENGKITSVLVQFSFLNPLDKVNRFDGHKAACFNLFTKRPIRIIVDSEKPGSIKAAIRDHVIAQIIRKRNPWLRKVWDQNSTPISTLTKFEIV